MTPRINLNEPRWDQSTYWGRVRHFFAITNPLNILASEAELNRAKEIVETYKAGGDVGNLTEDELWRAKELYDSAFHPDTGEKMMLIGRMSAQVPMNMTITGCMMTFYKSTGAVVFWQWVNQSFNALVNYTNRSGDSPVTNTQLASSYVLATGGALTTALSLNRLVKSFPPIIGRFVPFVAVAAANCVNIPMMRLQELREGVPVADQDGKRIGNSKVAAQYGIAAVTFSRIAMATPGMAITPFVMDRLEKRGVLQRFPWSSAPIQTLLCGFFLTFATPMCCALFSQKASIATASLEPELQVGYACVFFAGVSIALDVLVPLLANPSLGAVSHTQRQEGTTNLYTLLCLIGRIWVTPYSRSFQPPLVVIIQNLGENQEDA